MEKQVQKIALWESWEKKIQTQKYDRLAEEFQQIPAVEVSEFLENLPAEQMLNLLKRLPLENKASIVALFSEKTQVDLYERLGPQQTAPIFIGMPSDVRADLYKQLTEKQQAELLPFIPKKIKQDIITLSAYADDVAGGIMSTDFVTLHKEMSVEEALHKIREDAPQKMIYTLYVVDDSMRLLGFIQLKKLLLCLPKDPIKSLINRKFVYGRVDEDREAVASQIEKYDLLALPILNSRDQLVGIVGHEDALVVIRHEQTEDMERFMGILSSEEHEATYLETSVTTHFKQRIVWLLGLFLASFLSAWLMDGHLNLLERLTILTLQRPAINDAGGNAGSQAAMMILRGLALKQIMLSDWRRILWKEVRIAFLKALVLFGFMFLRIYYSSSYEQSVSSSGATLFHVALATSITVALLVILSTLLGAMLPILFKALNLDPALAASPAITTIVDVMGSLIYLKVIIYFFESMVPS